MRVAIADLGRDRLEEAKRQIETCGSADVLAIETDVADEGDVEALADAVFTQFGSVNVLMNNAGISPRTSIFSSKSDWDAILGVNLMGVIHGTRAFGPRMLAGGQSGMIINTGSKQGITTPPGNPAYNLSKAGVKAYTEALEHELRNTESCQISAHLLIPGFVFTSLTKGDRTEKPEGAWTPEQTVDFMIESLGKGDFYILCPDNETSRTLDEKRMAWAVGDIIANRPPLSRWHKDYGESFQASLREK